MKSGKRRQQTMEMVSKDDVLITYFFFFFSVTATTEIYTLSLHDALPISEIRNGSVGNSSLTQVKRL